MMVSVVFSPAEEDIVCGADGVPPLISTDSKGVGGREKMHVMNSSHNARMLANTCNTLYMHTPKYMRA